MIIMLCSNVPGAGKDTVANLLSKKMNAKIGSFASPIKELAKLGGWDGKKDDKGRELLIGIGEIFKKYDKHTWSNMLYNKIFPMIENNIIISDFRYVCEIDFIEKISRYATVLVIGIERDGIEMNEIVKENQSEYSKLPKNFIIKNNGTLSDLEYEVEKILNQIRRR